MQQRAAGLLLHPTSLPGRYGIGDLGPEAEAFLEWAAGAGQSVWQVLPLGPIGPNHSPYTTHSAFAGSRLLISPERLADEGLLPRDSLEQWALPEGDRVAFGHVRPNKVGLLRLSWKAFEHGARAEQRRELEAFVEDKAHATWLNDWALYAALREHHGGRPWTEWDPELAQREPDALRAARGELAEEISFHRYVQFLFLRQWKALHRRARSRGVFILGDLPIYVAHDSADVWTNQRLFRLGETGWPDVLSGVPPDSFSETGQLWGTPLYRWDRLREEGYAWWIERMKWNLSLVDLVRVDHFRAFAAHWEVPAGEVDARRGRWVEGPGHDLFRALRRALGNVPLIAEDLGHITDDVAELRQALGIPGMKVLQFGFSDPESPHHRRRVGPGDVVYTGTHDNDTARGWFASLGEAERRRVVAGLGSHGSEIEWDLLRAAYASPALLAMAPLQDVCGLGAEARMNTPSRAEGNWLWRATKDLLSVERAERLRALAEETGRLRPQPAASP